MWSWIHDTLTHCLILRKLSCQSSSLQSPGHSHSQFWILWLYYKQFPAVHFCEFYRYSYYEGHAAWDPQEGLAWKTLTPDAEQQQWKYCWYLQQREHLSINLSLQALYFVITEPNHHVIHGVWSIGAHIWKRNRVFLFVEKCTQERKKMDGKNLRMLHMIYLIKQFKVRFIYATRLLLCSGVSCCLKPWARIDDTPKGFTCRLDLNQDCSWRKENILEICEVDH